MLTALKTKVMSLKSAHSSDPAEIQSLRMALSSPPPAPSSWAALPCHTSLAYDRFMQEPYRAADLFAPLKSDGSSFVKWLSCLNQVLCVSFNTKMLIDNSPSSINNRSPEESRAICHFINASIPHEFALCIGVTPSRSTAKDFFETIKAHCCPGNCFEKNRIICNMLNMLVWNGSGAPRPNNVLVLSLRRTFAMFKKLGIEADEFEGLLAQAACHAPATLDQTAFDQLVTAAILLKGNEKLNSTFVGQVILNASAKADDHTRELSPSVYRVADPPTTPTHAWRPPSLGPPLPWHQASDVRRPPDHLINKLGAACFHCGRPGHWRADCPSTKGFANPNPRQPRPKTPEERPPSASSSRYQHERVFQVQFVEHHAADKVLIDSGASIHLSGSAKFATDLRLIHPFRIFFADSNSSITITKMATLKIPVKGGLVVISDVAFCDKVLGMILSVGRLCRAGGFPLFSGMVMSLVVHNHLVTTTFHNDCWWMNITAGEETNESAAETSSPPLIAMNPISFPATSKLSCREWHIKLRHASDKVVRSFLKQHVPSFELKSWQPFYCEVCAKSKSTHQLAKACIDIPMNEPLDLLVSEIMCHFTQDPQGYWYLLTIRDHVSTYSIMYPLKSRSDAPAAILDAIAHLKVQLGTSPKALQTDNAKEFVSTFLTMALSKLGISFHPSLPYSPQENGEAKHLNRTLGDMARAMLSESGMPDHFWQFAYASACYLHNRLPNRCCPDSSPHQVLYGHPPSIVMLYPFGKRAIVHVPAVNQLNKLVERGVECRLLKPLLASGVWLLWDLTSNQMIHSAKQEEKAINSLPLEKDISVPENLKQALASSHQHHWERACLAELDQMKRRNVWQAIDRKPGMKTIGHFWVFDKKIDEDGNIEKFKAQLVARGDQQRPGVDCTETYAPTASLMSLRLLLATACLQRWKVCSFDVSGAYLYIPVEETVLMELPAHFIPYLEGKVLRLQKALYGMKQAGHCWWLHLSGILEGLGFTSCKVDLSLYVFRKDDAIIVIWIHVDGGVIASNSPAHIE
ncbi:hypothetical protein O181_021016 [Austropuccinia psidii MF-1]|uniref:Integrase catalytic domain-containing protein n=1 Tax=Austropuccinia psidii MF-1 TaxID=1389203 RepID=A0A9Q3GVC6_9BASI|nr:hypothetical protein [Austropuccinia psidii MF-1]